MAFHSCIASMAAGLSFGKWWWGTEYGYGHVFDVHAKPRRNPLTALYGVGDGWICVRDCLGISWIILRKSMRILIFTLIYNVLAMYFLTFD